MTRKRFIKLVMAMGDSRNRANRTAAVYRGFYTYERAMDFIKHSAEIRKTAIHFSTTLLDALTTAAAAASDAMERLREAFIPPRVPGRLLIDRPAENALYADTKQWPKQNPHLDGYSANLFLADELETAGGGGDE